MSGYTKLFNSILASTIWRANDKTRLVWITMLAMADRRGCVEASVPGLADFAHVELVDCVKALEELASPDPYSRSKDSEGRRIEVFNGGWRLINHGKYREAMSLEERRNYKRMKQREYRKRRGQSVDTLSTSGQSGHIAAPTPAPAPAPKDLAAKNDPGILLDLNKTCSDNGRKNFSTQEMQNARKIRDNGFGCQHTPKCKTVTSCLTLIMREARKTGKRAHA